MSGIGRKDQIHCRSSSAWMHEVRSCASQVWEAASDLRPVFDKIDRTVSANTKKVLKAFRDNRIGPHHFQGSTGYGHGDWGRESLDNVNSLGTLMMRRVALAPAPDGLHSPPLLASTPTAPVRRPPGHGVNHGCRGRAHAHPLLLRDACHRERAVRRAAAGRRDACCVWTVSHIGGALFEAGVHNWWHQMASA